ncbi:MAG: hypothetical protein N3A38_06245 [Planctomycetota bacterium]|nr:hypothetical protein [Planctomycetota bacterium]
MAGDSRATGGGSAPTDGRGGNKPPWTADAKNGGTANEPLPAGGRPAGRIGHEPFGCRAVRMGFVSWEQVEKALAVQRKLRERGINRLIGMIMIELEMLDTTQLLSILKSYELEREADSAGRLSGSGDPEAGSGGSKAGAAAPETGGRRREAGGR